MDIEQAQAWVLIGGMIVTTITGIAGVIVSTVNSLRLSRTEAKVDAQATVSNEIKASSDGTLSIAREALQIQKDRSDQLEAFIKSIPGVEVPEVTKQTEQKPVPMPPAILLERLIETAPLVPAATTDPPFSPAKTP